VAEMAAANGAWQRGEVFGAGRHIASYADGTTYFPHADWLGTERVRATAGDNPYEACASLWFGDGLACRFAGSSLDPSPLHFTGKQRDAETGLDYFGARYNASQLGRFMTPDPLGGHLVEPQTLNGYVYVRDNPVSLTDPTGLDFYLSCNHTKANASTCRQIDMEREKLWVQGTTGSNNKFNPTIVTSASLQDPHSGNTATVNQNGVQITTTEGTAQGVFISNTPAANGIQGTGALRGFTFDINGNCSGTCLSSGSWSFNGSLNQARALLDQRGSFTIPFEDAVAGFGLGHHPFSTQHRLGGPLDSPHLSVPYDPGTSDYVASGAFIPPRATVPATGGFHVDAHSNWLGHLEDVWNIH